MDYPKKVMDRDPIQLKQFKSKYTRQLYNLLSTIPILLVAAIAFYSLSFLSTRREAKMSSYLEKASKWNEENLSEKLANIRFISRIMPSRSTGQDTLYLDWVSMTTETEEKDATASQSYYYNRSLHIYNNTKDLFPTLNYNPEFVPVGDSKTLCINLMWAPAKYWRVQTMYKYVRDLPTCSETTNPKYRW
jgi:hypothetical protein